MVEPEHLTAPQIADRYTRTLHTIRKAWTQAPDWPAPSGKRGRARTYDAAAVDAWVRRHTERPTVDLEPTRLYTATDLEHAGIGIKAATIRADLNRGRWPAPDDTGDGVNRWRGQTVLDALANRRAYRRHRP